MTTPHRLTLEPLPEGKRVQDVLPAFADVTTDIGPIGTPCSICPSCRKPFDQVRKRRMELRLYPAESVIPFALRYDLCGSCAKQYRAGGEARDGVIAAIDAFLNEDAPQ